MRSLVLVAALLALAACNSSGEVHEENASIEKVQDKVAKAVGDDSFVRPGRWESRVTVEQMLVPGMNVDLAEQMNTDPARLETHSSCLTPEQAKRPQEDFFTGANKNCRYDRFNMEGGKIDAVMQCGEGSMRQTVNLQGSYTPDTYNMQMALQAQGAQGASGAMQMKMRVDARRVGDCTGQEG